MKDRRAMDVVQEFEAGVETVFHFRHATNAGGVEIPRVFGSSGSM
jgi:hypothetical protein